MDANLSQQELQRLSCLDRYGCIFDVVREWALISGALWAAHAWPSIFVKIAVVVWIGARQHALGTLVHDAAHWRLHNNRRWNDWLGDVFCAWPIFLHMKTYRHVHLLHHRNVGTPQDPELVSDRHPATRNELLWGLLRDICGLSILRQVKRAGELSRMAPQTETPRMLFYFAIAILLTATHTWTPFLLYWVLPIFTYLRFVVQLRSIADHAGLEGRYPVRSLVPNFAEKWLIAPRNVSYHAAHHRFMGVPSKNLPKLHDLLLQDEEYRRSETKGFFNLVREFSWRKKSSNVPDSEVGPSAEAS